VGIIFRWKPGAIVSISLHSSESRLISSKSSVVVFDCGILESSTMNDRGLQIEVLGMFRTQLSDVIRQLDDCLPETDWRFVAHTLRGTAAAVGATEIAVLAEGWQAGRPLSSDTLDLARQRFEDAIQTVLPIAKLRVPGAA
jgi:HPt (histidine-containing phosphotransfer) domain-containing protein